MSLLNFLTKIEAVIRLGLTRWVKLKLQKLVVGLGAAFLIAAAPKSGAFALLGPTQPWMQATNGVITPYDIGGPMCISNEYRWNVPVVTYGFDQSFLNYFGSNGVSAVQAAIQVFNDLPPASQVVLTNYPFLSDKNNETAANLALIDLKSETLSLLLEQMGLADPVRYFYVIRLWDPAFFTNYFLLGEYDWPAGTVPTYIAPRNFDPITFDASEYIDDEPYSVYVLTYTTSQRVMAPYATDPTAPEYSAVAGFNLSAGEFYTGLTYDDVGGLAYLLSTNNVNYENLLPGVIGVGTNAGSFVNGSWRPGVDKITFIPHPVDPQSGAFLPTTNCYTDKYFTNGVLQQQQLARVISMPDLLFKAGEAGPNYFSAPLFSRTGTSNWLNNAEANGNTNGAGPGVIQPPIEIMFNKSGRCFSATSDGQAQDVSEFYGSFDATTNPPVIYPTTVAATNQLTVRLLLNEGAWLIFNTYTFDWKPVSATGDHFTFQTSTNLTTWVNLFTVTNDGSVCTYVDNVVYSPRRFYRLIKQ